VSVEGDNYCENAMNDRKAIKVTVGASTPAGTDFWFVAPNMSEMMNQGIPMNRPAFLAISNGTSQEANVTITLYNGGAIQTITVPPIAPGSLHKQDFASADEIKTIENPRNLAGNVTKFGTHITSDVPVTIYYMLNHTQSRDIFTLKGHQALGTIFYVPMQSDNAALSDGLSQGRSYGTWGGYDQVDIVATEDGTPVEIIPNARIRMYNAAGTSYTLHAAKDTIRITMNKGETYKLHEYAYDEMPSLTGTKITSTKPIAVTVTEDLVGGDTSGDQIVPIPSLGTRYIVPRGYIPIPPKSVNMEERFYLIGAYDNTSVDIYASGSTPDATITLDAGEAHRYTFPNSANAIYVRSTQPVYLYQRSGNGEEGACLLPSIYAIGQTRISFFQVGNLASFQKGFLLFRDGAHGSFNISYGAINNATLPLTPLSVPNMPDWKVARFDLPAAPTAGQVITIQSSESPFSLGYITGADVNGNTSYGYFSDFTFELPDTTYKCTSASSVVLEGGYAASWEWTFPDGHQEYTQSITALEEGEYTLIMNQDPTLVTATTFVKIINAGTISSGGGQQICSGTAPATLTVGGSSGDTYQWQSSPDGTTWTNINGATSPTYSPGILTVPGYETQSVYYRRGITANHCQMIYTGAVEIKVSPCAVIVNPHLRTEVNY
jgi:hypothetical protein